MSRGPLPPLISFLVLLLAHPSAGPAQSGVPTRDDPVNPLSALAPLLGGWTVPADVARAQPELRNRIVHEYGWVVGSNALRVRENFPAGSPEMAELEGIVHFDPATERISFIAVAGRDAHQGRLFRGEYRLLEDGRVERIYDVFYRTAADTPGEELGGRTRRFRETYLRSGNRLSATLDWWRDGGWQPFGPGTYELVLN